MTTVTSRLGRKYQVEALPFNEDGGQGLLYHCTGEDRVPRVYKKYKAPVSASSEIDRLHRLAILGREAVHRAENGTGSAVPGGLATTAESSINWPIDVIHGRNGDITGVVLPLIPQSFMFTRAEGGSGARTLDFLYLARAEPPPPEARVRLGVLLRVCDIFKELEGRRLTHGDLSAKNLVWRKQDTHAYLIDCDGLTSWNHPPTHGVATQEWTDPRRIAGLIPAHDRFSDRFALALVLYRGLFLNPGGPRWQGTHEQGRWTKPSGFPDRLDPLLRKMFSRALDDPYATATRPSAADWHQAVHAAFLTAGRTPSYRDDALYALDEYADQHRQAVQQPRTVPRQAQVTTNGSPVQTPRTHPQPRPQPQPQPQPRVNTTRPRQVAPPPTTAVPRARTQPRPAPARRRRTTAWVAFSATAVALAGAGTYYWYTRDSAAPATVVPLRAGASCPGSVAARIPGGDGATVLHAYTTEFHRIVLCRTTGGRIYYDGTWLHPDAKHKKSDEITIPAERTADGYRARNLGFLYVIKNGWVTVDPPKGAPKKYRLSEAP
ncbi:hypothetical protein AB0D74_48580 [Streptomyces sp. NPDC048278]|uniref:hypothetical protein n=1 Tax=Streptomyces sp. NPDC048278 TaxID=3155809 RepID=UPI003444F8D6